MSRFIRAGGLVLAAVLAVGTTGCVPSDNAGKLEGTKWQSASVPDFKGVSGRGMSMTLQFGEGGRFSLDLSIPQGATYRCGGRWRLGPGDAVYLDDVTPALGGHTSFAEAMSVTDDTLTMRDPDGTTIVFTRLDAEKEKADKEKKEKERKDKAKEKERDAKPSGPTETITRNGKTVTKTYGP